jgi:hypothetical protein
MATVTTNPLDAVDEKAVVPATEDNEDEDERQMLLEQSLLFERCSLALAQLGGEIKDAASFWERMDGLDSNVANDLLKDLKIPMQDRVSLLKLLANEPTGDAMAGTFDDNCKVHGALHPSAKPTPPFQRL